MNDARRLTAHRPNASGSWATTLDSEPGVRLTTFWQRRMAVLANMKDPAKRAAWPVLLRSLRAAADRSDGRR